MAKKKKKEITEYTEQELTSLKKGIFGLLMVIAAVVVAYLGYYIYLFATGTFDSDRHLLGLVPMFGMMVAGLPSYMNWVRFDKELKRRAQEG